MRQHNQDLKDNINGYAYHLRYLKQHKRGFSTNISFKTLRIKGFSDNLLRVSVGLCHKRQRDMGYRGIMTTISGLNLSGQQLQGSDNILRASLID